MAAVDLHVGKCNTYAQHPSLRSAYRKKEQVIGGKLFSFCCIEQCLNQQRAFEIGVFQIISKQGGGWNIEFLGVFTKQHAEFPGVNQKKVEFPRKTKRNSCEIFRGLGFLALKFLRDLSYMILPNIQGGSLFCLKFPWIRRKNKKIHGFF